MVLDSTGREYDLGTVRHNEMFYVFGPQQDPRSPYAAVIPKFITAMLRGEIHLVGG